VFTLKREALGPDLVGLHLAEAHELVTVLQEVQVGTQISEALAQRRHRRRGNPLLATQSDHRTLR
jgi:hypothetical protein